MHGHRLRAILIRRAAVSNLKPHRVLATMPASASREGVQGNNKLLIHRQRSKQGVVCVTRFCNSCLGCRGCRRLRRNNHRATDWACRGPVSQPRPDTIRVKTVPTLRHHTCLLPVSVSRLANSAICVRVSICRSCSDGGRPSLGRNCIKLLFCKPWVRGPGRLNRQQLTS